MAASEPHPSGPPLREAIDALATASAALVKAAAQIDTPKDDDLALVRHAELDLFAKEAADVYARVVAAAVDLGVMFDPVAAPTATTQT